MKNNDWIKKCDIAGKLLFSCIPKEGQLVQAKFSSGIGIDCIFKSLMFIDNDGNEFNCDEINEWRPQKNDKMEKVIKYLNNIIIDSKNKLRVNDMDNQLDRLDKLISNTTKLLNDSFNCGNKEITKHILSGVRAYVDARNNIKLDKILFNAYIDKTSYFLNNVVDKHDVMSLRSMLRQELKNYRQISERQSEAEENIDIVISELCELQLKYIDDHDIFKELNKIYRDKLNEKYNMQIDVIHNNIYIELSENILYIIDK